MSVKLYSVAIRRMRDRCMIEQEAMEVLKKCGWSYLQRQRRKRLYVYAARRVKGRRVEKYVGPVSSLACMTKDELERKLL
jgi:hypothetical protein